MWSRDTSHPTPADVRTAAAAAREHGEMQRLCAGVCLCLAPRTQRFARLFIQPLARKFYLSSARCALLLLPHPTHISALHSNCIWSHVTRHTSHQPVLRLQAVCDIADVVSHRSRASLSVRASACAPKTTNPLSTLQRLVPSRALPRLSPLSHSRQIAPACWRARGDPVQDLRF